MIGFSEELARYGDCTGRWRWSPWTVFFRWFGIVRLEVEYVTDFGSISWRKARYDEWQHMI